ncbi:DUF1476 domain-containing protein [Brevirhabdus sp.]|uniref:DUF1476 domain-containing protein n=1 Tax=Brevirhabdus sp. TaxID=2004514 RepID=UPI0040597651
MTGFQDREKAFENKFAHDADMLFRAEARRNRLLGLWAAELMGRTGDEAAAYVTEVIRADFQHPGDEDVFRKLRDDLGPLADEVTIRAQMHEKMAQAKAQVMEEL